MARVVGIDHLSIRVSDYEKSKAFYGRLFAFLGFEVEAEYPGTMGWKNGHTLFWIGQADSGGRRKYHLGDVGIGPSGPRHCAPVGPTGRRATQARS